MKWLTKDRSFYRDLLNLTSFIALQNLIACFVGLVDNVMIGAYSQEALSGVALANQIQFFLQMLAGGIADGMAVIASQYWGTRRTDPIRRVVVLAVGFELIAGFAFLGVAQTMPGTVLSWLTPDVASAAEGAKYMRIVSWSYPMFAMTMLLVTAQRCVENVRVGMIASLSGLGLNIVLNYALIFGRFGCPEMGAEGAAWATLAGRTVELGVALFYTAKLDKKLQLRLHHFRTLDKTLLGDLLRVGTPVFLASASWGIAMTVQTAILGHMEDAGSVIAANSIANTLFQVITVVVYGLAGSSGVVIGKAVGRDDQIHLKEYVRTLQVLYVFIGLLTSVLLFAFRPLILSMYSVTAEAYQMASDFIGVLCITVVGTAYQCACLTGIVRGGGNTKFVFYNDLIFMWGIVLPLSLLAAFVFHWPPVIVFFCLKCDQLLKCLVAIWQVNSYHWVKKVTRTRV